MKLLALVLVVTACGRKPPDSGIEAGSEGTSLPIELALGDLEHDRAMQLRLTVEPGVTLAVDQARLDRRSAGDFTWRGTTSDRGAIVVTSRNGQTLGTIFGRKAAYRIEASPNGRLGVKRLPPVGKRPPHEVLKHGEAPPPREEQGPIELIVAYTPKAAKQCSTTEMNIELYIQHAVDQLDTFADNSGIATRFKLAHAYKTDFDETDWSFHDLVNAFAGKDDAHLQDVHGLRKSKEADLAILFVAPAPTYVGLSKQTMADKDTAFAVVNCSSVLKWHTLAHEVGHLLGLNDDDDDVELTTFKDGYGYPHDGKTEPNYGWRTIMSRGSTCAEGCPLIPYWSNPAVNYDGKPTGVPGTSDNARVFKETAGAVSWFSSQL